MYNAPDNGRRSRHVDPVVGQDGGRMMDYAYLLRDYSKRRQTDDGQVLVPITTLLDTADEFERLHRILWAIWNHSEDKVLAPNLTYGEWFADLAKDSGVSMSPSPR